jgi:hypothetical protein
MGQTFMKFLVLVLAATLQAQSTEARFVAGPCSATAPTVLIYLPPGTNGVRVMVPTCARLGPEFRMEAGELRISSAPRRLVAVTETTAVSLLVPNLTGTWDFQYQTRRTIAPGPVFLRLHGAGLAPKLDMVEGLEGTSVNVHLELTTADFAAASLTVVYLTQSD